MVLGLLEMVSFNVSLRFEGWVKIQGHEGVGVVVLKVDGEYLEWNVNHEQKVFFDEAWLLCRYRQR